MFEDLEKRGVLGEEGFQCESIGCTSLFVISKSKVHLCLFVGALGW